MIVRVLIPFCDARDFAGAADHRLSSPPWPLARPGQDFVRRVGRVRLYSDGGAQSDWWGQGVWCDASKALRLPPRLGSIPFGSGERAITGFQCVYRRYGSDGGAVSQLQLALASSQDPATPRAQQEVVASVLACPVRVPGAVDGPWSGELAHADHPLASLLLRATSSHRTPATRPPWWMTAGEPLAIVESRASGLHETAAPGRVSLPELEAAHIGLWFRRFERHGRQASVWFVVSSPRTDRNAYNRLVLNHLPRLHAERACLKAVLRLILQRRLTIRPATAEGDALQRYLTAAAEWLVRPRTYGINQELTGGIASAANDLVAPDERETLLQLIDRARPTVRRRVEAATADPPTTQVHGNLILTREVIEVGGDTYNVHGQTGAVGPHATASGNTLKQVWVDSLASVDLDQLARELASLRNALAERDDDEQAAAIVASAERSAHEHDGPGVLRFLSAGGKETLGIAREIGAHLAAQVIMTALHAAGVPFT